MALAQYAAAEDSWDDDLEMPEDGVLALPAFRPEPVLQVNTEPDAIESVPQPEPAEAAPTNKVVYVDEPVVNEITSEAAVVAEPAVLEATTNASVERVESQPFADQATDASPGQAEVEAIAVTAEPEVAPLAAQASAAELVVAPVIDAVQVEVEGALGEVEPVMQTAASSMSFMDDGGVVPYKLEMTQSAQELVPLADLRSIGSSTSNFNDDLDFSDSASQLGKGPVQYQMPDKDGSSASLDAFLDCGASDVSRPSVPQALRRMMHSPAPSHGTAASNMDFEGDDFLADFEVPESFEVDGSFLERRLHLTRGQSSSFALLDHPPSGGDDTDMFDDLEVPEDAFARAYQAPARQRSWNAEDIPPPLSGPPGHSFNEPAPENLQIRIGPGISVTTVPVHEVSELDDIDDLEVSIEKESKFETAPRLPNLLKRNRAETANSGTAGGELYLLSSFCYLLTTSSGLGNTSPRRIEIRSSLTAPTASFLAKMREPVRQSQHKNQNKVWTMVKLAMRTWTITLSYPSRRPSGPSSSKIWGPPTLSRVSCSIPFNYNKKHALTPPIPY